MADQVKHPALESFRREMNAKGVTPRKASDFEAWKNGPKCTGDIKEAADALWNEYQANPRQYIGGPPPAQAPSPVRPQGQCGRDNRPGGPGGGRSNSYQTPRPQTAGRPQDSARQGGSPGRNAEAAKASVLGEPFHNPYTFLPFPKTPPTRVKPTPLTIDEDPAERSRFTGVLELELTTLRPLLTCDPNGEKKDEHRLHKVLAIGKDVIVPATGIRGALRTLMTVLTGGTLGYIDDEVWLCQGRDLNLGPAGPRSPAETPVNAFLARVEEAGSANRSGRMRLGETRLIAADNLRLSAESRARDLDALRKRNQAPLWTDLDGRVSEKELPGFEWQLKLSGRPINRKGKCEGMFRAGKDVIELPPELWGAYLGRNRHGEAPELREGDLVWLEPVEAGCTQLRTPADVRSIQWARWGRKGENLLEVVRQRHRSVVPDSFSSDGLVDEVTNLFGQVPNPNIEGASGPFAARIRPENLLFQDALPRVEQAVPLAPLAPPHPGCAGFYRDQFDLDLIRNRDDGLRGYKVYRVASDKETPWRFQEQGVYDEQGRLKSPQQGVNKTCDLLKAGEKGLLKIAVRALSQRELALILAACSVDWRLGGGKPLGLGLCRVKTVVLVGEDGKRTTVMTREGDAIGIIAPPYDELDSTLQDRMKLWQASQTPVEKMRYPRAVQDNRNRKQRGGHAWFGRHAVPKKGGDALPCGLQVMWTEGDLEKRAGAKSIQAQNLPPFDPSNPEKDKLFGYDCVVPEGGSRTSEDKRTLVSTLEPFEPSKHTQGDEKSGGPQAPNRNTRQEDRKRR